MKIERENFERERERDTLSDVNSGFSSEENLPVEEEILGCVRIDTLRRYRVSILHRFPVGFVRDNIFDQLAYLRNKRNSGTEALEEVERSAWRCGEYLHHDRAL
jgi:hypothetical protein